MTKTTLDKTLAARFAGFACAALAREYPNHLTHWLNDEADLRAPHALHPAFYGALDWHSAVHNHWLLARLLRLFPLAGFAAPAQALLNAHLNQETIAAECAYFAAPGREGFERPYGWAWLLALDTELAPWPAWRNALAPLAELIAGRISPWRAARRFYLHDRAAPLAFEPSGQDFLSPMLAEADLMRRVLASTEFPDWLAHFLPGSSGAGASWLAPAVVPESADYKLAHLAGLNLSRAWMLAAIADSLPPNDPHRAAFSPAADAHFDAGLPAALRRDYGASHWLPSFAVYALTRPGAPIEH